MTGSSDLKQLSALLKVRLLTVMSVNRARYSRDPKDSKKLRRMLALYGFIVVMMGFYMIGIAAGYHTIGLDEALMPLICAGACVITLISSILSTGIMIFGGNDISLVMSLPVKNHIVVLSRLITGYLFELGITLVMTVPVAAVYYYFNRHGAAAILLFALVTLFLPMIPIVISNILGAFIRFVTARMKKNTLFSVIFTFIFVIAIMVLVYNPKNADTEYLAELAKTVSRLADKIWPLASFYGDACRGELLPAVVYIGVSVAFAALFILVFSRFYNRIQSAVAARAASKNYKMTAQTASGKLSALYRKELRRYLSCTVWVTNTGLGAILSIAASIAVFFIPSSAVERYLSVFPGMTLAAIAPIVLTFIIGMGCTTSSSISLEGRQRWILQSLPVSNRDIYASKMLVSFTVTMPASIISAILLTIALKPSPASIAAIFIVPIAVAAALSSLGLFANLKMQNYDWTTEVTVVKQSVPTLVTIFGAMLLAGLTFVCAIVTGAYVLSAFVLSAVCLCAAIIFWRLSLKINIGA